MSAHDFIVVENEQGTFEFHGVLTIHQVDKFKEFLEEQTSKGIPELLISFGNLEYIDITALQVLIAFKNSKDISTKLQITGLSSEVEEILVVSGLKTAVLAGVGKHGKTHPGRG